MVGISVPPPGRAPMGKPMAVPRSQGFQDRAKSSRVIPARPLMGTMTAGTERKRLAT